MFWLLLFVSLPLYGAAASATKTTESEVIKQEIEKLEKAIAAIDDSHTIDTGKGNCVYLGMNDWNIQLRASFERRLALLHE